MYLVINSSESVLETNIFYVNKLYIEYTKLEKGQQGRLTGFI